MATTSAKKTGRRRRLAVVEGQRAALFDPLPEEPKARERWFQEALLETTRTMADYWAENRRLKEEVALLRIIEKQFIEVNRQAQAPARAKAEAHASQLPRVAQAYREVEGEALKKKKAAVVKDRLGMSLPTYRRCIREIQEKAARDPEIAAALRSVGFPV